MCLDKPAHLTACILLKRWKLCLVTPRFAKGVASIDSVTVSAAMLLCTEDTLSRPMPHVYTMDPDDKNVAPVVALDSAEELHGNSNGNLQHDVRVKDLRVIAQQQVGARALGPASQHEYGVDHSHSQIAAVPRTAFLIAALYTSYTCCCDCRARRCKLLF